MTDESEEQNVPPLRDALTYPLRESGKILLIIGAVLSALLSLLSGVLLLSAAASLIGLAYFNAYYFSIVETTVAGKDEAPDWPDISDLMEEIIQPFVRTLGVWLLSFGPYIAVVAWVTGDDGGGSWTHPLTWLALAWAVFYFPMAILNVIVANDFAQALPQHVLPRIFANFPPYLGLALLLAAAMTVSGILTRYASGVPFVGGLLSAGTALYFMMAQARLAGLFYLRHLEEQAAADDEPDGLSKPRTDRQAE